MSLSLKFLLLALLALTIIGVHAEEADDKSSDDSANAAADDEPEEKKSTDGPGITTAAYFPRGGAATAALGEYNDVLVGVANSGDNNYRVEFVLAYLTMGNYYVQNFTGSQYNRTVGQSETATLRYRFKPDPILDTRDYNLIVQVFYMNDDNETFLSTPYNGTVTLVDGEYSLDGRTLFTYGSLLAAVVMGGYALYTKFGGDSKSSKPKKVTKGNPENVDYTYVPKEHFRYVKDRSGSASSSGKRSGSSSQSPSAPKK